ncbi:MAG: galactokinase family protein [Vicinamibacterales bacterium]
MTIDLLLSRLQSAGLPEGEIERKRQLCASVLDAFAAIPDAEPTHALWVPGRVEVFGKHTDYCGGHSLVGAVPRGLIAAASARSDQEIRLHDAGRGERLMLSGQDTSADAGPATAARFSGWRNYAHVVARRLARNFPGARLGADIVFASDLPSASGMSSSSALMIAIAAMLGRLARIHERDEWRRNIPDAVAEAGYYACIENGMSFGELAGDAGVGTHGGSEDHAAIVCGRPGELSAWRFVPIRHVDNVRIPDEWQLVIASSGVAARKTGEAREAYNRLSREGAELLDVWNRHEPSERSLRAALSSAPDAAARLERLLSSPGLVMRLSHFLREDARIAEAVDAFRRADRDRLSRLSDTSQADAEQLLRNQVPETIDLARTARDLGAFAASAFGAGFGGSVWALVDGADAPEFAARWLKAYRSRFPHRSTATTFVAAPGPPLTFLAAR